MLTDQDPSKGMQKEMRGIYNVTFNGKNATEVRKADTDAVIKYERGFENSNTGKGRGAVHIEKHLPDGSVGQISKEELLNIGEVIRSGKLYESYGKNVYELEKNGVTFKVITGSMKNGNERVITFYSNRNIEEGVRSSGTITSTSSNIKIIPQNQRDARLFEWHKSSHPLTKNEDGSPRVFYHGTNKSFDEFAKSKQKRNLWGDGFYFAEDMKTASDYAKNGSVMPVHIKAKNVLDLTKDIPLYVARRIIPNIDTFGLTFKNGLISGKDVKYFADKVGNFSELVKNAGFDGIRYLEDAGLKNSSKEYKAMVVFEPTQIKSINNKGTYDNSNPNILMASPTAGGGAFGGSDALINQRDYDGDGEFTYKDLLIGAGLGAGGVKALQKAKPDWFKNDFKDTDAVAGMFTGAKPTDKGAFSDIATKKMMREIDDSGSRVLSKQELDALAKNDPYEMVELPLEQVIKHPELFKQYPELKEIKVSWEYSKASGLGESKDLYHGASYDPKDKTIMIGNGLDDKEIKSALLHEIQHAIQSKEGWARGGSPSDFSNQQLIEETKKAYGHLPSYNRLEADLHSGKISQEQFDKKMLEWGASDHTGGVKGWQFDNYQRLWGEQQARATQYRANYTPEQRMGESWTDTLVKQEGAYNEPIIKYDDGVAMHISSNKPLDEKIAYLQNETRESFKKIKNPTAEQKAMYDLIMGLKKVVGIQRQDSFDIAQVLVNKGYQRTDGGSGLDHIIFRHFGEGAEGELSAREILNIGKTIQDGTLTREVPRDLKDKFQAYEKVRVYKRNVNPKDDVNLYVVVGEDRNKIQNVITYYSNRNVGAGDNLSKSTTEIPIKGDISSTVPGRDNANGKIVSQPTENVNPNMRGGFVNNPFHETPEGARDRIQHAVNMVQKELSKADLKVG